MFRQIGSHVGAAVHFFGVSSLLSESVHMYMYIFKTERGNKRIREKSDKTKIYYLMAWYCFAFPILTIIWSGKFPKEAIFSLLVTYCCVSRNWISQTGTTQQGLIKHGGSYSTTGARGMRAHNSNNTADHHVRHSIPHSIPPLLNHNLLITHKFSSVTSSVSLAASVAEGDNVYMAVLPDC